MRASRFTSRSRGGFTLVEVIVTLAILAAVLAFGLFLSLDAYRGYTYRSERTVLVALLTRARSHALANIGQGSWGVCKEEVSGTYLLFRGTGYAPGALIDERLPSGATAVDGVPSCESGAGIVFSALSATTTARTISVAQTNGTSTLSINEEGTISW